MLNTSGPTSTLWNIAAPFVAAFAASWCTYWFGQRGKLSDLSSAERLAAFRVLKPRLLALRRYAEARAGNIDGGDFEPRTRDLPDEIAGSFLGYRDVLRFTIDEYRHILPAAALAALRPVRESVDMACSMELVINYSNDDESNSAADLFRSIASNAGQAVDELWKTLKLPV